MAARITQAVVEALSAGSGVRVTQEVAEALVSGSGVRVTQAVVEAMVSGGAARVTQIAVEVMSPVYRVDRTISTTSSIRWSRITPVTLSAKSTQSRLVGTTCYVTAATTRIIPLLAIFDPWVSQLGLENTQIGASLAFMLGSYSLVTARYVPLAASLQYLTTQARVTQDYQEVLTSGASQGLLTQLYEEVLTATDSKARVTQVYPEVVYSAPSSARVTQEYVEAVFTATSNARITQDYIEVLIALQKNRSFAATGRFQLTSNRKVLVSSRFSYTDPTTAPLHDDRFIPLAGAISKYLGVSNSFGPTVLYLLNETSGIVAKDSSGNNHDGTYNGGFTLGSTGPSSDLALAATFGGSNGYVSAPLSSIDWSVAGITWAAWVNPTAANNWCRFIDFGNGSPSDNILIARSGTSNSLDIQVYNNTTTTDVQFANVLAPNQGWFYLVVTIDPSGAVWAYKDGLVVGSAKTGSMRSGISRANNYIGRSNWSTDGYYAGKQTGVFLLNRVLSYSEALKLTQAAIGDENTRTTSAWIETVSQAPTDPVTRVTEAWIEAVAPAQVNPLVRTTSAWIEAVVPSQPDPAIRVTEAWIEAVVPQPASVIRVTEAWIEVLGKVQSTRIITATAQIGLASNVPVTAALKRIGNPRLIPVMGYVGWHAIVTQMAIEVVTQGARAVVTQAAIEVLVSNVKQQRTVSATASLETFVAPRNIPVISSLRWSRFISTITGFRTSSTRSMAVAAEFTKSRSTPLAAAFLRTSSRNVTTSGQLRGFDLKRLSAATAALQLTSNRLLAAQVRIGPREHAVPTNTRLFDRMSRIIPTLLAPQRRFVRLVWLRASLGTWRVVPAQQSLMHTSSLLVSVIGELGLNSRAPAHGALELTSKRSIAAHAVFGNAVSVPVNTILRFTNFGRTMFLNAELGLNSQAPTTAALTGTSRFVSATTILTQHCVVPLVAYFWKVTYGPSTLVNTFALDPESSTDVLIDPSSMAGFPTTYPFAILDPNTGEIMEVVGTVPADPITGDPDSWVVVRGVAGTTAHAIAAGDPLYIVPKFCWQITSDDQMKAMSLGSKMIGGVVGAGGYGGYPEVLVEGTLDPLSVEPGYDDTSWPYVVRSGGGAEFPIPFTPGWWFNWHGTDSSPTLGYIGDVCFFGSTDPAQPVFEKVRIRARFWVPTDPAVFNTLDGFIIAFMTTANGGFGGSLILNGNALPFVSTIDYASGGYGGFAGTFAVNPGTGLLPGENHLTVYCNDVWSFGPANSFVGWGFIMQICGLIPPVITHYDRIVPVTAELRIRPPFLQGHLNG